MLELRTGLPGAGKTLNTLFELVQDSNSEYRNRPKFYNNIPLFYLDFDVCASFAAFLYGHLLQSEEIKASEKEVIKKRNLQIRRQGRFPDLEDFPMFAELYNSWLEFGGDLKLWLSWVKRVYSSDCLSDLNDYLKLQAEPTRKELERFHLHFEHLDNPREWFELPRNSVLLLDECQRFFPPRKIGSVVPRYISEFETHRHLAITVILITQNAGLLDFHIRKYNEEQQTLFYEEGKTADIHQEAKENIDKWDKQEGDRKTLRRPKTMFGLYHSADIHTHKMRVPRKVYFLLALLILVICLIWYIPYSLGLAGEKDNEKLPDNINTFENSTDLLSSYTDSFDTGPSGFDIDFNDPTINRLVACDDLRLVGFDYANTQSSFRLVYYVSCATRQKTSSDDEKETEFETVFETFDSEFLRYYGFRVVDMGRSVYITNPSKNFHRYLRKFY